MGKLRFQLAVSLDGFVAGPHQSLENPLGVGGTALHERAFALEAWRKQQGLEGGEINASTPVLEESQSNVGATIVGRNMFGGGRGPWSDSEPWNGWWGDNPPFHNPVFVLTHHPRRALEMQGGTTFNFVTDGIDAGLEQAAKAAAGQDVAVAGGASVAQQYLAARLIDEFELHIVPVLLREGERLLEDIADLRIEQVQPSRDRASPTSSTASSNKQVGNHGLPTWLQAAMTSKLDRSLNRRAATPTPQTARVQL